ncbi:glycosyltransferase family 4 protein [Flavobacteriaceae bacterium]|nr:glycosyltransferase family 4 protein [Flavobacteriaceae bacterium]
MKIIFLTNSNIEKNGWSVLGKNIYNQLKLNNEIRLFTSDKKSIFNFSNQSIRAERYTRGRFFLIFDFFKILFYTLKFKPDIVHCNTEYFAPIALLLSKFFKVPFTVSVAGTYGITLPKKYKIYSYSFKRAEALICLSNYTKKRMEEEGVEGKKVVIKPGYDSTIFKIDNTTKRENSISFVGNFKPRKGFKFLLDAICKISDEIKIKLYFIGDVDENSTDYMEALSVCKRNQIEINILKQISDEKLVDIYRKVKLNILPSYSVPDNFEGFGLIHYEAIACGTLTIGTKNSGNEDAIIGKNGFLIKYGDVESLSKTILKVLRLNSYPKIDLTKIRNWETVGKDYNKLFIKLKIK